MKFLIWFGFCFIMGLIQTLLRYSGIILGALPTIVLYTILWIPAERLSKAWDIKRYKKKYPDNIIVDMINLIESYKNDFLIKKNFDIQDEGVEFFDIIKDKISALSIKEINKTMIQIVQDDSSPKAYVLGMLEEESVERVIKGNVEEITKQNGRTYTISKIYEYVYDIKLKNGMLTPVQYENGIKRIGQICEENLK